MSNAETTEMDDQSIDGQSIDHRAALDEVMGRFKPASGYFTGSANKQRRLLAETIRAFLRNPLVYTILHDEGTLAPTSSSREARRSYNRKDDSLAYLWSEMHRLPKYTGHSDLPRNKVGEHMMFIYNLVKMYQGSNWFAPSDEEVDRAPSTITFLKWLSQ